MIRHPKDCFAGLVFVGFGALTVGIALSYPVGSAMRMGPGYFPAILGGLLVLMGLSLALRAFRLRGEPIGGWTFRPLLSILGSVLAFALLVQPLGLVLASLALVVLSRLGGDDFRIGEVAVLYLLLTGMSVGLFVYALGLPFRVWPG